MNTNSQNANGALTTIDWEKPSKVWGGNSLAAQSKTAQPEPQPAGASLEKKSILMLKKNKDKKLGLALD